MTTRRRFLAMLGLGTVTAALAPLINPDNAVKAEPEPSPGPRFANGGPVPAGKLYLVGERGCELLVLPKREPLNITIHVDTSKAEKALRDLNRRYDGFTQ